MPTRLLYQLEPASGQRFRLTPFVDKNADPLDARGLKSLRNQLHELDTVVARDLLGNVHFGILEDPQLARLLPLLARRKTRVLSVDRRLRLEEESLSPRVEVAQMGQRLSITLKLEDKSNDWLTLDGGRLIAGAQAFFLRGATAYPIECKSALGLRRWSEDPTLILDSSAGAQRRDSILAELIQVGVPPEDLAMLAVRRGPPDGFSIAIIPQENSPAPSEAAPEPQEDTGINEGQEAAAAAEKPEEEAKQPEAEPSAQPLHTVHVRLSAQYDDLEIPVTPHRPEDLTLRAVDEDGVEVVIERSWQHEAEACNNLVRQGMRFDRELGLFVAQNEAALRILDPSQNVLPTQWQVSQTEEAQPVFRKDLRLHATVQLAQESGMLDVSMGIQALGEDDTQVEALIQMRGLLEWLRSGQKYLQLEDGSFVAPSAAFRQDLHLLEDLGADRDRALLSPMCLGLLRALGDNSVLKIVDDTTQAWLEELTGHGGPRHAPPPEGLEGTLRDYQQRGYDWLMMLQRYHLAGVLADDMGLGKTLQTLTMLLAQRENFGQKPSLVVAPASVVSVWRDEAERFVPTLTTTVWYGAHRHEVQDTLATSDLIITSYGTLRRDEEMLSAMPLRHVILDEAQQTKNAASRSATAVRKLQSEHRLALTGTPVENHPEEMWAMFDFLAPGFLGTRRHFRQRYVRIGHEERNEAMGRLRVRISPFVLRRLKSEVAKDLPAKTESVIRCEMHPDQQALYDHVANSLRAQVQEKIEKVGIEKAHMDVLSALTRLRQICCDPRLLPNPEEPDAYVPPSAKLALFEELIREALGSGRVVVVFSQFVEMQKHLLASLRAMGVDPLWLHGGTRDRGAVVKAFQDPSGPPVIVVSLRAGGVGLTLTRADTVILYDPWWNPAVEAQATDRAHRLGQTKPVQVYRLVVSGSIEERVMRLATQKRDLANSLLGGGDANTPNENADEAIDPAQKRISREDVMQLLQLEAPLG